MVAVLLLAAPVSRGLRPAADVGGEVVRDRGIGDSRVNPGEAREGAAVTEVDEPDEHVVARWVGGVVAIDHERRELPAQIMRGVMLSSIDAYASWQDSSETSGTRTERRVIG